MGFKCGIVGLPNVGKSTLFNALTKTAAAQAANYPFCTIEPNVGEVDVPDARLNQLAQIAKSQSIISTRLTFVDIAGLVKGAASGEGLGNQFLGNIRETDAIAHVLRCFEDSDITHVNNKIDPISDAETVETELLLADLESLEKRLPALEKKAKNDKELMATVEVIKKALIPLREGKPARLTQVADADEAYRLELLQLITTKPVLYVCNVDEASVNTGNKFTQMVKAKADSEGAAIVLISAQIEADLAVLAPEDQEMFLADLGLTEAGLNRLIREGYKLLDLITYFTVGPKEARAWTIKNGTKAPAAAGVIHSDFEKGFIRAETIAFSDYINGNGENGAKEAGKMRLEGKEYTVSDGDVMHFRHAS
jgi:GTP-binding protein YchF